MGLLLYNVVMAALKDGVSPTMIMASALLMALYLFSWYRGSKLNRFFVILIIGFMLVGFFAHLTVMMLYSPLHIFALIYNVLAGAMLVVGIIFVLDWVHIKRGHPTKVLWMNQFLQSAYRPLVIWQKQLLAVMIVACIFIVTIKDISIAMDPYMVALSNNIFADVERMISFLSLCLYTIIKFWLVWVVIILFSSEAVGRRLKLMVTAAFFIAVGTSIFM